MTYLEKINGEYPNVVSMETRVAELTQELKDISAAGGVDLATAENSNHRTSNDLFIKS